MSNFYLRTQNVPRERRLPTEAVDGSHGVRCFRASPKDVCLQLRRGRSYVAVSLTFEEAAKLADALAACAPVNADAAP